MTPFPDSSRPGAPSRWQWPALACLLALAWIAYSPGLSGGFLFDDFVNLDALGNYGRVDNWAVFWRYITSGTADPIGRPIALLSFLLDARDWPADPAPFLRTNLLIHLGNGVLLFLLLRTLQRALAAPPQAQWLVALLATGLWLLHPLFVSTTLYAVQREAMLPATFTLAGLLVWAIGRLRFPDRGDAASTALMVGGIGIGTLLAVLSKANGILLPVLALVLEWTIFSRQPAATPAQQRRLRLLRWLLLALPSLAVFAFLASYLPHIDSLSSARGFSPAQRLLTQPRVLLDYLHLLLAPRAMSTGLFNDGYIASTDLWHPWTTAPSIAAIAALLAAALGLRGRAPAWSASLLFFLAGHLMESSVISLELFFEHRNYLPAMLLFWPVARALWAWRRPAALRTGIALALLALLAFTTFSRASLWGQPERLGTLWAMQNASSSRAQTAVAITEIDDGQPERAFARLLPLWRARPHDLQLAFNTIDAACQAGRFDADLKQRLAEALEHSPRSELLTYRWLGAAIDTAAAGSCENLDLDAVESWLQAALRNPLTAAPQVRVQDIEPLLGQIALRRREPALALEHFDRTLLAMPSPDVAARAASMLAEAGYYEQALAHLDTWERVKQRARPTGPGMAWLHARVFVWQGYWPREMALLRKRLHTAISERDAGK